jgi:glycosyltransferase involved in cell wall biosynthesis
MVLVSVILCTHNPKREVLERVVGSLAAQTLDRSSWEVVVVDNASEPSVESLLNGIRLSFACRIIQEKTLGLTLARLAGIAAAIGTLLIFVDDDTVLDPSYLENARRLMEDHGEIGVAGGRIQGEFEVKPAPWMGPHLETLAIRDFGEKPIRALISNECGPWEPCGAGMVIRASVARAYAAHRGTGRKLDRVGAALSSCGDTDMARTASDMGLFMAYDPSLRLTHVISRKRLTLKYLARLSYSIQRDGWLLYRMRGKKCGLGRLKYWLLLLLVPMQTFAFPPQRWIVRGAERMGQLRGRYLPIKEKTE